MATVPDLIALDAGLRGAAVALALLIAALLLRAHPGSLAARIGAAFSAGAAAYAVTSTPGFFASPIAPWQLLLATVASGNAVVFWLFAQALFSDGFVLRWWHGLAWAALAGVAPISCLLLTPGDTAPLRTLDGVQRLASLAITALALVQAIATWRADLVEGRRRMRVFIVGVAGAYALANTLVQIAVPGAEMPALANLANAAGLLLALVVIAWPLLRMAGDDLFVVQRDAAAPEAVVPEAAEPQAPAGPDPAEVAALERLMHSQHVYREEGLTIGALAARMGMPEYKLRRLINQGLGYRNFNAYLNHHRLADAKAALADPARSDVPVLSIAMDAGYQSLGPFNRAFKAETGMTPSEFRQRRGLPGAQKTAPMLADSEIG